MFVKGKSGNPEGRPKGTVSVVSALKRKLKEYAPHQDTGKRKKYLDLLVDRMIKNAIANGDTPMIKDIINRVDGMPQQKTDITSGGKPIVLPSEIINKEINIDE